MERLPELSLDLVQELDKLYPSRCPDLADTDREIWFNAGARAVVDLLMKRARNQTSKRRKAYVNDDSYEEEE